MIPSLSTTTTMLGIACISVLVMSRSRCSCDLALLALGDVDAAGDDARDVRPCSSGSGAVRQTITRRSPRRVGERVLVLRRGVKSGAAARKRCDHRLALLRVDEDVPEVPAADLLLVVDPARLDGGGVLVHDPALRVDARREARAPC